MMDDLPLAHSQIGIGIAAEPLKLRVTGVITPREAERLYMATLTGEPVCRAMSAMRMRHAGWSLHLQRLQARQLRLFLPTSATGIADVHTSVTFRVGFAAAGFPPGLQLCRRSDASGLARGAQVTSRPWQPPCLPRRGRPSLQSRQPPKSRWLSQRKGRRPRRPARAMALPSRRCRERNLWRRRRRCRHRWRSGALWTCTATRRWRWPPKRAPWRLCNCCSRLGCVESRAPHSWPHIPGPTSQSSRARSPMRLCYTERFAHSSHASDSLHPALPPLKHHHRAPATAAPRRRSQHICGGEGSAGVGFGGFKGHVHTPHGKQHIANVQAQHAP